MSTTPGSYLYKHFKRIIDNWPIDSTKSSVRNLRFALERRLEREFSPSSNQTSDPDDSRRLLPENNPVDCKRRLEGLKIKNLFKSLKNLSALQQLANNQHQKDFPLSYKSGMNGYGIEHMRECNTDAGRKKMGLSEFKTLDELQTISVYQTIKKWWKRVEMLFPKREDTKVP